MNSSKLLLTLRVNEGAAILNKIGVYRFEDEKVYENFEEITKAILRKKPESLKGRYIKSCIVKTGSGRPVKIDLD